VTGREWASSNFINAIQPRLLAAQGLPSSINRFSIEACFTAADSEHGCSRKLPGPPPMNKGTPELAALNNAPNALMKLNKRQHVHPAEQRPPDSVGADQPTIAAR
jgi:hypothetical protein